MAYIKLQNSNMKSIPIESYKSKIEYVNSDGNSITLRVNSEDDLTANDWEDLEKQNIDVFDDGLSIVWFDCEYNCAFLLLYNGRRFDENPFTEGDHTFDYIKDYFDADIVKDNPNQYSFVCPDCDGKAVYSYDEDAWICEDCGCKIVAEEKDSYGIFDLMQDCTLW